MMKSLLKFAIALLVTFGSAPAFADDSAPSAGQASGNAPLDQARLAIKAKDWARAVSSLNLALREDSRNADAHNLLGYSYRKQASPDLGKAFEHYGIALRLEPKHRGAHEYIGEAYLMDGKPAEAEKHLAALESICGDRKCEEYVDLAHAIATYKARRN